MKKIFLKKNEERRIVNGHLWVFSNEIFKIEEEPESGDIVEIFDAKNNLLGSGFFNKNSLIAVRMLSHSTIDDVEMFFREKIKSAYDLRKTVYPNRDSFRMVFSESDFLPGLIIDKYNKILHFELKPKKEVAEDILNKILEFISILK